MSQSDTDCSRFAGRMREICEGKTHHTPEQREQLVSLWLNRTDTTGCVHRGEQDGWMECGECAKSAGKKVMVRVFRCALYERCVIPAVSLPIQQCVHCKDRLAPTKTA